MLPFPFYDPFMSSQPQTPHLLHFKPSVICTSSFLPSSTHPQLLNLSIQTNTIHFSSPMNSPRSSISSLIVVFSFLLQHKPGSPPGVLFSLNFKTHWKNHNSGKSNCQLCTCTSANKCACLKILNHADGSHFKFMITNSRWTLNAATQS